MRTAKPYCVTCDDCRGGWGTPKPSENDKGNKVVFIYAPIHC